MSSELKTWDRSTIHADFHMRGCKYHTAVIFVKQHVNGGLSPRDEKRGRQLSLPTKTLKPCTL